MALSGAPVVQRTAVQIHSNVDQCSQQHRSAVQISIVHADTDASMQLLQSLRQHPLLTVQCCIVNQSLPVVWGIEPLAPTPPRRHHSLLGRLGCDEFVGGLPVDQRQGTLTTQPNPTQPAKLTQPTCQINQSHRPFPPNPSCPSPLHTREGSDSCRPHMFRELLTP
jgi:hypothetical protein